ncbi:MAG: phosphate/phosphite/phosphonate ABC transporter substrate-binding protein [Rhodospirillaceae bacterium]
MLPARNARLLILITILGAMLLSLALRAPEPGPGPDQAARTTPAGPEDREDFSFAIVPQFESRKLAAVWTPIIQAVAAEAHLHLSLIPTLTVREFERGVAAGRYDFVYANPFHILRESGRQGYFPLVRDTAPLRGILVVRADSPVTGPAELKGKVLAVPSPNAVAASLLLRSDLEHLFHLEMTLLDAKTHGGAFLAVAGHKADAGGGADNTLRELDPLVRGALRVIYTTREMPAHAVAAHPRVPEAVRERLRRALLTLAETPEGRTLLARVPMKRPVAAASSDYQVMADWGLERFWIDGPD